MKIIPYLVLVLLISCDNQGTKTKSRSALKGLPETIVLGQSTEKDVSNELGEPLESYEVKDATVNNYKDGRSIKLENNIVKGYFRSPEENELKIQYWLQIWKDKQIVNEKISLTENAHAPDEYQLINKEQSMTVIYDHETGLVKRVIHYEN